MKQRAAIVGVGATPLSRDAGVSCQELACAAINAALQDAGVTREQLDGLLAYSLGDSVPVTTVARALGLPRLRWHNDIHGGGSQSVSILWEASRALQEGLADYIVVFRAVRSASGARMGQIRLGAGDDIESQFVTPYGLRGPVNLFALTAQRWLQQRGHAANELYHVVARQREYAAHNPRAMFRQPLTRAQYDEAPLVASPLRRLDCCRESDGAIALLLCREELAGDAHSPVFLRAAVRGGGPGGVYWDKADSLDRIYSHYIAGELYRQAGLTPADIDLAMLYDAYSFLVPAQLEDFGFCERGRALPFLAAGKTASGGELPVNTNGGMLSEGYVHGLNNTMEAVLQLRGEAGERQVQGAANALCSGFGGRYGAAAILTTD
ncbi:MAG: acetyl-CoA acetyltransferase [Halioglobus sp.]|nr:acetyl-CoA acetyltransferase [Halioglobus sp.]